MTTRNARASVPASTSNLGSGFDCVGMAVDRWLAASVETSDAWTGVRMMRAGTLAALKVDPTRDLLYDGFVAACHRCRVPVPTGLDFQATSSIPVSRGLGSSAAALVAGAALADGALTLGLGPSGIAQLVSQVEGHPDHAAPSVFGGAMLGVARNDATPGAPATYAFSRLPVHASLAFIFAVPSLEVTTAAARAALPARVAFTDAVLALQRSAALVHGLAVGDADLLTMALDDVLHVPYRRQLVPGYDAVVTAACAAGAFGATLSGSGSAMLAVALSAQAHAVEIAMEQTFGAYGHDVETFVTTGAVGGMQLDA